MFTRSYVAIALLALCAAGITGCGGSDAPKVPLAQGATPDSARAVENAHGIIGPGARAHLDSGNALYRRKAFAAALKHYEAASALAPQHAAPFFGIYMVARATHDTAMADSALSSIRVRNGPMSSAPHSMTDSALRRLHQKLAGKTSTE